LVTLLFDALPMDGVARYYRARHVPNGPWTEWRRAIPGAHDAATFPAPAPVEPTLSLARALAGSTGTATLTAADPQRRVVSVTVSTQAGGDPATPFAPAVGVVAGDTTTYVQAVTLPAGLGASVTFRVVYHDAAGVARTRDLTATFTPTSAGGDAEVLLGATSTAFPAGRVAMDSTTVAWDRTTAGVIYARVPLLGITSAELGTGAVTTTKLGDLAVTDAKVASVGTAKLVTPDGTPAGKYARSTAGNGVEWVDAPAGGGGGGGGRSVVTFTTPTASSGADAVGSFELPVGVTRAVLVEAQTTRSGRLRFYATAALRDEAGEAARAFGADPDLTGRVSVDLQLDSRGGLAVSLRSEPTAQLVNRDAPAGRAIYYRWRNMMNMPTTATVTLVIEV
jgi:hypothetical protein